MRIIWELSSENYQWKLLSGNYEWELLSENYNLVYHHAEKLRFIGILAYPKIEFESFYASTRHFLCQIFLFARAVILISKFQTKFLR